MMVNLLKEFIAALEIYFYLVGLKNDNTRALICQDASDQASKNMV